MSDTAHPFFQLLQEDRRYKSEAYQFIREALSFGQEVLGMGGEQSGDDDDDDEARLADAESPAEDVAEEEQPREEEPQEEEPQVERHLTGQQLCQSIRQYAVQQYGYMAKVVLNSWGIHSTGDFGEIVYNLIRIEMMKRSKEDRREDFNDVYDFNQAFQQDFEITLPSD